MTTRAGPSNKGRGNHVLAKEHDLHDRLRGRMRRTSDRSAVLPNPGLTFPRGFLSPVSASARTETKRPMKNSDKLLTPTDVADRLQVHERTVTRWLRKSHLRGFKIGKEWRISPDDLQAFLEASANKPMDKPRSVA